MSSRFEDMLLNKIYENIVKRFPEKIWTQSFQKIPSLGGEKRLSRKEAVEALFPFTDILTDFDLELRGMRELSDNDFRIDLDSILSTKIYAHKEDGNSPNKKKIVLGVEGYLYYSDIADICYELNDMGIEYPEIQDCYQITVKRIQDMCADLKLPFQIEKGLDLLCYKISKLDYSEFADHSSSMKWDTNFLYEPENEDSPYEDAISFGVEIIFYCTL